MSAEAHRKTLDIHTPQALLIDFSAVNHVLSAKGHLQRKDLSPAVVDCYHERKLKYVKDVSCVTQLSFVKPVTNVQAVALDLSVVVRLQSFGKFGKLWGQV